MATGEWSWLISFARVLPNCKEGKQPRKKNKMQIYVSAGCRTSDPLIYSRTLRPLDHRDSWLPVLNSCSTVKWQVMRWASPNTCQYKLSKCFSLNVNSNKYHQLLWKNVDFVWNSVAIHILTEINFIYCIATCLRTLQALTVISLYWKSLKHM